MADLEKMVEVGTPEEPHVATILLLDTSGSMSEDNKINALNDGLKLFKEEISNDNLARKRVDLAVLTFGNEVNLMHDFSSIDNFDSPVLEADGTTPMGDAILEAISKVKERKKLYKNTGIDYYRPWIFMITDGEPTDMAPGDIKWEKVKQAVHKGESNKSFMFYCVCVEPANVEYLKEISPPNRAPVKLKQGQFKELFQWLSKSQTKISESKVGENVSLPTPTWIEGWDKAPT